MKSTLLDKRPGMVETRQRPLTSPATSDENAHRAVEARRAARRVAGDIGTDLARLASIRWWWRNHPVVTCVAIAGGAVAAVGAARRIYQGPTVIAIEAGPGRPSILKRMAGGVVSLIRVAGAMAVRGLVARIFVPTPVEGAETSE